MYLWQHNWLLNSKLNIPRVWSVSTLNSTIFLGFQGCSSIIQCSLYISPWNFQLPNIIYDKVWIWCTLSLVERACLFIGKKHTLSSLFLTIKWKNLHVYEPQFSWMSLNIPLSDSFFGLKKLQEKVLNLTCQTFSVCELLQIVNFDGVTF